MIEITNEQIERVNSILSGVQGGVEKVFYNAINRALGTIRTTAGKQIREVYAISQKDLRTESNVRLKKAARNDLVGEISFAGCKIPLYRFNVSPKQPVWRGKVKAAVLKTESQKEFEKAFVATVRAGDKEHTGVWERKVERTGREEDRKNSRFPIVEFFGPSVADMAGNSVVLAQVENAAQETINKRIEHEITRILSGYGG